MLEIENLHAGYSDTEVLHGISLKFSQGDFCAILGPNGAGKSTIFKTLIGLLTYKGRILISDRELKSWNRLQLARKISIIPQEMQLQFDYKVIDLVLMGRFPYLKYMQNYSLQDYEIAERIIFQLDIEKHRNTLFSKLSGGEKQRVSIARALVQDTEILLMDEGLSGLDINHQLGIMKILKKINENDNRLIILVSHNINLASDYCDRIIMLKTGKILNDGKPEEIVNRKVLNELYEADLAVVINPLSGKPNLVYPGK